MDACPPATCRPSISRRRCPSWPGCPRRRRRRSAPDRSRDSAGAKTPASPAGGGQSGGVARLQPDERTGRLLVVATEAAFARLAALAARLDVPAETRTAGCTPTAAATPTATASRASWPASPASGLARPRARRARAPGPRGPRPRPPPSAPAAAADRTGGRGALFAGEVRVTSDPTANALLVLSSLDDFRALAAPDRGDRRPPQAGVHRGHHHGGAPAQGPPGRRRLSRRAPGPGGRRAGGRASGRPARCCWTNRTWARRWWACQGWRWAHR